MSTQHKHYDMFNPGHTTRHTPKVLYYPDLLGSRGRGAYDAWDSIQFERYPEAEEVAKALLECLGRPDAAYVELKLLGKKFICGRCDDREPKSWDMLVRQATTFLDFLLLNLFYRLAITWTSRIDWV
jgi:hypothetical protein